MTKTKGKTKKKAIVAVARKLVQLIYTILKSSVPYQQRPFPSTPPVSLALCG